MKPNYHLIKLAHWAYQNLPSRVRKKKKKISSWLYSRTENDKDRVSPHNGDHKPHDYVIILTVDPAYTDTPSGDR